VAAWVGVVRHWHRERWGIGDALVEVLANLGMLPNASMVRNNLEKRGVDPAQCQFRMVGHGPLFDEGPGKDFAAHKPIRDKVGAIEKKLAEDLKAAGYDVLNEVRGRGPALGRRPAVLADRRPVPVGSAHGKLELVHIEGIYVATVQFTGGRWVILDQD
jgi:hypothetical protein